MKKRLIIGATGASGIPILIQCLKLVQEQKDFESYLVMTDSAKLTLEHETKMKVEEVEKLADHVLDSREIGAGPVSYTHLAVKCMESSVRIWNAWTGCGE